MPPCYDFTTSPLYSATTAQLSFPSHFSFYKIHFLRQVFKSIKCSLMDLERDQLWARKCFSCCCVQSQTFVTFACLSDGN